MANQKITDLPAAQPLTGTESVPIVQQGITVRTTTAAIAASPSQQQSFLTVNGEPTLPNSRQLSAGSGLGKADGGAQGIFSLYVTGAAASLNAAGTGLQVKTDPNTLIPRQIAVSGPDIAVSNPDGVAGNPTLSLTGQVLSLANASGNGLVTLTSGGTVATTAILGTSGQVAVANGSGIGAQPTISLAASGVTPGTYGSSTQIPVITVDSTGRATLVTTVGTSGSVGSVSVTTANGFAGTVTNPTTSPAITLSTTVTGLLKGNGTSMSAAVSGTDYAPATSGSSILSGNSAGGFSNVIVGSGLSFVGGTLSSSATGTVTSVGLSMPTGFTVSGSPVTGSGTLAVSTSLSGILKGTGTGFTTAVSGTDYAPATSGSSILYGNGLGGFSNVTVGSGLSFSGGTLSTTGGYGTVTSVSVSGGTTGLTTSGSPITTSGTITLGGTLNVASGGTGATSLTGYVYGNGTGAMTASTTIPTTALSGTINNAQLQNNSVTYNGVTVALGGSGTITANTPNALSVGTGLAMTPGTSFNGSAAQSISIGNTGVSAGTYGSATAIPTIQVNAQGQITSISTSPLNSPAYQGTWNASTNSPTLTSSVGTNNNYYVVSTAGTTTLNGISLWSVGDWVIFNGTTSAWEKINGSSSEAFNSITVTGLTGYMYANNSSAVTASTTIPTSALTGVLPIANGGTNGTATPTAGAVAYGTGTAYGFTAAGTAGQFLQSTGSGIPTWSTPSSGSFQPAYYGTFVSTTNQTNGGATTANAVSFDTPGLYNGVSITSGNQITFANAGTYLIEYELAFASSTGANPSIFTWLSQQGTNIANTTCDFILQGGANQAQLINQQWIVSVTAGQYIQVYWSSSNTNVSLVYQAASSSPTKPASPSAIINVSLLPPSGQNLVVGSSTITGGTSGNVLYDNAGTVGELAPAALTSANDTNVTLTLGGTPATSLLKAASITAGWTGTLAAARLNANVVQAVTNDTNVTGSISAQNLTLGWTGTLAVSRGGTGAGTLTGLVKGNGTSAFTAAVSGTDYAPATSGSAILYGNGAGGFSSVTIGSGVSFSGGTLSATGSGGTVTSITAGTGLSGGTITSTGTVAIANTTVTAASYGNASTVATFTVNAQGQLTAAANATISIPASAINTAIPNSGLANSSVTFNGTSVALGSSGTITAVNPFALTIASPLTGTSYVGSSAVTIGLSTAGTAGTYGSASSVPVLTTDTYGRVTSVTPTTISIPASAINTAIPNSGLANSSITINGTATALGGSISVGTVTSVSGTTGQITSTGGTTPTLALASTAVTAGSYTYGSFTVDAYGRLTAASSGTAPVTSVTGTSPVASSGGTTPAISLSSGYGDTQNPYASKTANYVLAAPNGSAGTPSFRALVAADIPALSYAPQTSGTSILYGNGSGGFSNVTIGTGLTFSGGTLSATGGGTGTVTSVNVSGGTTGLTTSGGPVTTSGTITLAGTLGVANGGTGVTSTPTNGQLLIGNGSGYTAATLTAGSNITITNGAGSITIASTGGGGGGTSTGSSIFLADYFGGM